MTKNILLSNTAFFLGLMGITLGIIPLLGNEVMLYHGLLPILFGIAGFIIVFQVKKELNDDMTKVGLVFNPIAIILGIIQMVLYFIN
ncbi:MAG: hypothetical protein PHN56_06825 [Candidatus Nanoarchaeia archaeon]|nr:hypothetical protein [Candidatus Nanoarchaeia archaeon]